MQDFDLIVVGGGMVGAAIALGLAPTGMKIAVLEKHLPQPFSAEQGPDLRVSAISAASEQLLRDFGAWQYIEQMRLCPYQQLAVWEKPDCKTLFDAKDINTRHLGHIIENRVVQLGLHQALAAYNNVVFFGAPKDFNCSDKGSTVMLESGDSLRAPLLVAADGLQSRLRQAAGIGTTGWQYGQQALGITVKTHQFEQHITWQQFSASGPMAFLPLYDGYASLVWYHKADAISALKALSDSQLKAQIVSHFPEQLVDFDILQKASFPLMRMHANRYFQQGVVLAGDAAHSINPLAGQGVNLGFKDVKVLVELLTEAYAKGENLADESLLAQYQKQRRNDNLLMMSAMDGLYAMFSNNIGPLSWLRNMGLKLAQKSPLKPQMMKYAMGLK